MGEHLKIQNQIRQNADEVSAFLSDIQKWEIRHSKSLGRTLTVPKPKISYPIRESGTVKIESPIRAPDSHVYDKGYQKWETFDFEAALKALDVPTGPPATESHFQPPSASTILDDPPSLLSSPKISTISLTPANIVPVQSYQGASWKVPQAQVSRRTGCVLSFTRG
jgi:hypothetical protein